MKNIFRRKNAKEEENYEDLLRGEETKYLQKYLVGMSGKNPLPDIPTFKL